MLYFQFISQITFISVFFLYLWRVVLRDCRLYWVSIPFLFCFQRFNTNLTVIWYTAPCIVLHHDLLYFYFYRSSNPTDNGRRPTIIE